MPMPDRVTLDLSITELTILATVIAHTRPTDLPTLASERAEPGIATISGYHLRRCGDEGLANATWRLSERLDAVLYNNG